MADRISPEHRSWNMSRIKGKDTKIEVMVRQYLFHYGFRFRKNDKRYPGKPDVVLPKYKTAIFVHGCFWHRHQGCKYAYSPKSRVDFWEKKFANNMKRDEAVKVELSQYEDRQLIVWECTIKRMQKNPQIKDEVIKRITSFLLSDQTFLEI